MKKLVLALIFMTASTVSAFAAEIQGTVESIDIGNMMITLADGTDYKVAEGIPLEILAEGVNVILNTNDNGTATDIMLID